MKREKELIKNTIIIAFGTILPKVASVITLPIITGQLKKNEYGIFDLVTTLIALFLPIVTLQIQTGVFRFLIEYDKESDKISLITTICSFIFLMLSLTSIILIIVLFKIPFFTRILIILYFIADVVLNVLQQIARGLHLNQSYSFSAIILSVANLVMVIVCVQIKKYGLNGALISIMMSTYIAVVVLAVKINIWKYIRAKSFSRDKLKKLLSYSWPMIPNTLSNWVMNLSDRLIITAKIGVEANAIYSVSNKLPNLFTSIQGTFVMAWQENASIVSKDDDINSYYSNMFNIIFRIYFAIMACLMAVTPWLFNLLIKGDYSEAYYHIPILYLALFFSSIASFIGGIYVAVKQTRSIGVTTVVAAILNIVINLIFIDIIGIYAASISTCISYLVLAVYRMKEINRHVSMVYDIVSLIKMNIILIGMVGISYINNIYMNLLNLFIAIIVSICFNGDIIRNLIKRKK